MTAIPPDSTGNGSIVLVPIPKAKATEARKAMTELRLDLAKAERMIAQILRDEQKMLPKLANDVAATICRRLFSAMPTPTNQALSGYRLITMFPPGHSGFTEAVSEKISDVDDRVAMALWEMVWKRCTDLPPGVADSIKW